MVLLFTQNDLDHNLPILHSCHEAGVTGICHHVQRFVSAGVSQSFLFTWAGLQSWSFQYQSPK
jgi:hypothetical protein